MSASPYGGKAVRAGMAAFLLGRAASAVLGLLAFSLAARLLPLAEYGRYATALALLELSLALAGGGLDWVSARVLPDCRIHAGGRATVRLVLRLAGLQALTILAAGALVWAGAGALGGLLQLADGAALFRLAAVLICVEGLGRLSRDHMLGILMEQRAGQVAQVLRAGSMVLLLAWAWHSGQALDAGAVLRLELAAASAAALAGTLLLARALWRLLPLPANRPDWRAPPRRELLRLALHNYASYLLSLAYGPQVMTMLIVRLLGADAAAVFGFARAFSDQVRRYLPTDLLQSVVRPALIAFYAANQSFTALSVRLGLWLKVSLMVLFPLLVFFAAFGEQGMLAIGGARYTGAWPVVLLLLCSVATVAWRRVLELGCNTVLQSDICVRATAVLVVVPPLVALALQLSGQLLLAVALVVLAECVFGWRVVRSLKKRGFMGAWDVKGFVRLLAAWTLTVGALWLARHWFVFPVPAAIAAAALASLAALRLAVPLSAQEGGLVAGWHAGLARAIGSHGGGRP